MYTKSRPLRGDLFGIATSVRLTRPDSNLIVCYFKLAVNFGGGPEGNRTPATSLSGRIALPSQAHLVLNLAYWFSRKTKKSGIYRFATTLSISYTREALTDISMNLKNIPFGEVTSFNAVIEIPQGSQDKYEYDPEIEAIRLDRVLYSAVRFPFNYGFVPQTLAEDGDPADVVLLSTNPLFPGVVAEARAIGFMEMVDSGEVDNKIIAVPTKDPRFADIQTLEDLPEHTTKEIQNFFETYKLLQNKTVEIKGFHGKDRAIEEIEKTHAAFKQ